MVLMDCANDACSLDVVHLTTVIVFLAVIVSLIRLLENQALCLIPKIAVLNNRLLHEVVQAA